VRRRACERTYARAGVRPYVRACVCAVAHTPAATRKKKRNTRRAHLESPNRGAAPRGSERRLGRRHTRTAERRRRRLGRRRTGAGGGRTDGVVKVRGGVAGVVTVVAARRWRDGGARRRSAATRPTGASNDGGAAAKSARAGRCGGGRGNQSVRRPATVAVHYWRVQNSSGLLVPIGTYTSVRESPSNLPN